MKEPTKRDLLAAVAILLMACAVAFANHDNVRAAGFLQFVALVVGTCGVIGAVCGHPFLGLTAGFCLLILLVGGMVFIYGVPC